MAFDEGLAERIRARLGADPGITQKRMFGGLAFLHEGNMAVGVIGDELMVRVGPDATEAALARPGTRPFDFTGRPMRGWVVVAPSAVSEDEALADWVDQGHTFAASLPPK
ncbi:TfoX/Sxy family protein [Streptomyces sp. NPDC096153]|uniref:TfoX/Sxy family protein n=1 Tax=Streptomyces sp. NPDC096153 TaxID=3155548 RepID=UPI003324FB90